MIFKFTHFKEKIRGKVKDCALPLAPVRLLYKPKHKFTPVMQGLLDSGADYTYCHLDIGLFLGIDFKKKKPIVSRAANGSEFKCFIENLHIIIGKNQIITPVKFSNELNRAFQVILGRKVFFDKFKITFEQYNDIFRLEYKK